MTFSNSGSQRLTVDHEGCLPRRATTLLELLVVVTIMLVVTGIAIRTVMPALEGRQIREGARQLNVFINSARNRAMVTGRPMGVWIDRMTGLPEAAVAISYAQVPEPYSGDYLDSAIEGFIATDTSQSSSYGARRVVNVVRAGSPSTGYYDFWCNNGVFNGFPTQRVIRPGDTIMLNYRSQPYRLMVETSSQLVDSLGVKVPAPIWSIGLGLNQNNWQDAQQNVGVASAARYTNEPLMSPYGGWYYPLFYFNDQGDRITPFITPGASQNTHGKSVPYQILRQPIRSAAGSMQLPDTVVIDLNFSGDDQKNYYQRQGPAYTSNNWVLGTGTPDPYQGNAWNPSDTTPIIIMFSPSGAIEQVYTRYFQPSTKTGQNPWIWRGDRQLSTINLLVGSRDRVPVVDTTSNWTTQLRYNWTQASNIWVAIQPRTGMVTAAEVVPPAALWAGNSTGSTGWENLNLNANVNFLVLTYLQGDGYSTTNARGYSSHGNQMSGQ